MTQRERLLSIAIGGLIGAIVLQWGFSKYRAAITTRSNQITTLTNQKTLLEEQVLQGAFAEKQMGEYLSRSLPGNPETAQSEYQNWLLGVVGKHVTEDPRVNATNTTPVGDLYTRISFSVDGETTLPKLIELLHDFYAKDYLHRVSKLLIAPTREDQNVLDVKMSIDAIALSSASEEASPPKNTSWRVDKDLVDYKEPILNRNFFEPPNQSPKYTGKSSVEAIVNKSTSIPLTFKDPDSDSVRYELIGVSETSDGKPEVSLNEATGTLSVLSAAKEEFEVKIRATDNGFPARSIEQTLIVKVTDPPPPPKEPEPEPEFDDAKQTVLTALVQGRDDWTAWMNVRTRGKTLKLRVGDKFEIGSVSGEVIEVTPKYVMLEIDGIRFSLRPAGILADAASKAKED